MSSGGLREVLAQLAGPAGQNFSAAIGAEQMDAAVVQATGACAHENRATRPAKRSRPIPAPTVSVAVRNMPAGAYYEEVLTDLDTLVATDTAFQIGPWIAMAKKFGECWCSCSKMWTVVQHDGPDHLGLCAPQRTWRARR